MIEIMSGTKKKRKKKKEKSLCESAVKLVYFRLHSYILCVEQQRGGGEGKGKVHYKSSHVKPDIMGV